MSSRYRPIDRLRNCSWKTHRRFRRAGRQHELDKQIHRTQCRYILPVGITVGVSVGITVGFSSVEPAQPGAVHSYAYGGVPWLTVGVSVGVPVGSHGYVSVGGWR